MGGGYPKMRIIFSAYPHQLRFYNSLPKKIFFLKKTNPHHKSSYVSHPLTKDYLEIVAPFSHSPGQWFSTLVIH